MAHVTDAVSTSGAIHAAGIRAKLGELLVEQGRLSSATLDRARHLATESVQPLELVLGRMGLVSEFDIAHGLSKLLGIPVVAAAEYPVSPVTAGQISLNFMREARLIPLESRADALIVAMVDPLDNYGAQALHFATGKKIKRRIACAADFEAAFQRLYGDAGVPTLIRTDDLPVRMDEAITEDIDRIKDGASEAPVIRLVNALVTRAVEARASDIHVEPTGGGLRVRFRIDGVLQNIASPPPNLAAAVVSRIKVMAKLNLAERRVAQDGRLNLAVRGKEIDFRVSTMPTIHGESVVLRILDRASLKLDFQALGFEPETITTILDLLDHPHGILLATGPTGSGKTTTLYAGLHHLNTADRKILTVEDPVEYRMEGINQVQVKPQVGLTFASALRSFLRQDPDVMMVGEIRDLETAQIAVQAALTGHLLLSTLHTNDAASAVTRLLDMGIDDFLLTSTVNGLIAQRLVRALCHYCREPYRMAPEIARKVGIPDDVQAAPLYRARGCDACGGIGFIGRSSIVEVLVVSDPIRQMILQRAEAGAIRRRAIAEGMQTMHMQGIKKVLSGQTSIEEVLRATRLV